MRNLLVHIMAAVSTLFCVIPIMAASVIPTPEQTIALHRSDVLNQQGNAALRLNDFPTAEADFRASLNALGYLAPLSSANYGLAEALVGEGRVAEAIQVYRKTLPPAVVDGKDYGRPSDEARLQYALLLDRTGQWAEAVQNYEAVLAAMNARDTSTDPRPGVGIHFDPALPASRHLAAMAHLILGLYKENEPTQALREFDKALRLAPDSDLTNYYYGYGLQQAGRAEQASTAFRKTIKMAHGDVRRAAEKALKKIKKAA